MKNKNENEKILWWKEAPAVLETKFGRAKINAHGYYHITSSKEGNSMKLLHRLIFEDFYRSPIPEGFHVHHINENKLDNRICNLKLLRASEHRRKHMKGIKFSLETRKKISDARKKYFKDPENRKKMSDARKGSKHPMYNKKHSLETRKKMSDARKGSKLSLETRKKISDARKGSKNPMYNKKHSLETRKKMSKSQKERRKKEKEKREKREKNQTKIEQF